MPNARQKILNYIIERQSTTVEELSRVFRVTPANIRHHLSILIQQGSVKTIGQKPTIPKGRPAQIYSARQETDRNNLDRLSDVLLNTFLFNNTQEKKNQLINVIAKKIAAKYWIDSSNPTRLLYSTIYSLNRMNYQAHWEAHFNNPRLMIGHCPYRQILDDHPELCQMDAILLENLLNSPVRQIEKQAINVKNLPECVFLIYRPN